MLVKELKEKLKSYGLSTVGLKQELEARLESYENELKAKDPSCILSSVTSSATTAEEEAENEAAENQAESNNLLNNSADTSIVDQADSGKYFFTLPSFRLF